LTVNFSAKAEIRSPGGVAQWTSNAPQEQKTRVQIPPGYKVLGKSKQCCCGLNVMVVCRKREVKGIFF
jgi:hypothetical protein